MDYSTKFEDIKKDPKMVTLFPEYTNVTVSYNSFQASIILLIVFLLILVGVFFFLGYYYSNRYQSVSFDKYQTVKHIVGSDKFRAKINELDRDNLKIFAKDFLDKKMCESPENEGRTHWDSKEGCKCNPPYWGSSCQRELHGSNYIDIGTLKSFHCKLDVLSKHKVDNKSFVLDKLSDGVLTCEQRCESNQDCVGYIYNDKYPNYNCILLASEPVAEISYDSNVDGDLYLHKNRSKQRPNMGHTVVLYKNPLPLRFWASGNASEGYADIGFNHINRLTFYPSGLINDSRSSLIFSNKYFDLNKAKRVLENYLSNKKQDKDFYVYIPDDKFLIPLDIVKGGYWVIALGEPITCYRHDQTEDFTITDPRDGDSETLDFTKYSYSKKPEESENSTKTEGSQSRYAALRSPTMGRIKKYNRFSSNFDHRDGTRDETMNETRDETMDQTISSSFFD